MKCYQCGKYYDQDKIEWWGLHCQATDTHVILCSPSCMVEYAWELKERQPKLSKSKVNHEE